MLLEPTTPSAAPHRAAARRPARMIAMLAGILALMGMSAGATYALMSRSTPAAATDSATTQPTTTEQAPSPAEATAAKNKLCGVFDVTTRNSKGAGGFRDTPVTPNIPVVLRALGSAVAIQGAMADPALPPGLADAADVYVSTSLRVANAAMSDVPVAEVNELTAAANDATRVLIQTCGL